MVISLYSNLRSGGVSLGLELLLRKRDSEEGAEALRGQEVGIVFASHLTIEILSCKVELVFLGSILRELFCLLLEQFLGICLVDSFAFGCDDAVATPLPELTARDFGRGCVFLFC